MRENMWPLSLWAWLKMMFSSSIYLPANILLYGWIILHCIYIHTHTHFIIYSSIVGHLGCFQSLAIVNSAVITWVFEYLYSFSVNIASGICRGVEHWIVWKVYFSFFRNPHTAFHRGYTNLLLMLTSPESGRHRLCNSMKVVKPNLRHCSVLG
jgi:hypothetical protein